MKPESHFLAVTKLTKRVETFTHDVVGAAAAVGFLYKEGGAIYRIDYYLHHAGTKDEEWLPRSTKLGEK